MSAEERRDLTDVEFVNSPETTVGKQVNAPGQESGITPDALEQDHAVLAAQLDHIKNGAVEIAEKVIKEPGSSLGRREFLRKAFRVIEGAVVATVLDAAVARLAIADVAVRRRKEPEPTATETLAASEFKERAKIVQEKLSELKGLGYNIDIQRKAQVRSQRAWEALFGPDYHTDPEFLSVTSHSATDMARLPENKDAVVAPCLQDPRQIPLYEIHESVRPDGSEILLIDAIDGSVQGSIATDEGTPEIRREKLRSMILARDEAAVAKTLDGIPTKEMEPRRYILDRSTQRISPEDLAATKSLVEQGSLYIGIRYPTLDYEAAPPVVPITPERLKYLSGNRLSVDGQITHISYNKSHTRGSATGSVGVKQSGEMRSDGYIATVGTETRDTYEFIPSHQFRRDVSSGEPRRAVPIELPIESGDGSEEAIRIETLFEERTIDAVGSAGPDRVYGAYTNLPAESFDALKESIEDIAEGIAVAEKLFGKQPGSVVSGIYVVQSNEGNAEVEPWNSSIVVVQDALLKQDSQHGEYSSRELTIVGAHEATHAVDLTSGISGDPRIIELYSSLRPEFLVSINEDRFRVMGNRAGHAQKNALEMFATVTSTLQGPRWKENLLQPATREATHKALHIENFVEAPPSEDQPRVRYSAVEYRADYEKVLKVFQEVLHDKVDPKAPIHRMIADRLRVLRNSDQDLF